MSFVSRRASSLRIAFIALAIGALIFLSQGQTPRRWASRLLGSAIPILSAVRQGAERIGTGLGGGSGQRLRALAEERAKLLTEIAKRDGLIRENELLRETLSLRQRGEPGAIPATAIAFFREGRDEFLLLNLGTGEGVGRGDIVLNRAGVLAGEVIEVGPRFSKVLLLTSASRSADVLIGGGDIRAIARGNNNREFVIDLVPQDAALGVGDLIVASPGATGGRRSILVGEIREVRPAEHEVFKAIRAVHLFDPRDADVIILPAP